MEGQGREGDGRVKGREREGKGEEGGEERAALLNFVLCVTYVR